RRRGTGSTDVRKGSRTITQIETTDEESLRNVNNSSPNFRPRNDSPFRRSPKDEFFCITDKIYCYSSPDDFENLEIHPSHNKLWNLYLKNYFHILGKINPNLETILKRAAPPTYPQIRELVLKYFIDNFKRYSKHYNPETVDIAFLPCSNSNGYARPSDCFINDECTIMNLQTIREDLRSKAEKLGVRQIPDYKKLKEKLIENPPQNKNEAKKIFEYLNRFNYNWSSLINIQFIPIQDESKINNKYFKPCDCFFKLKEESLNEFFLCVDFGTKANKFLAKCGVRDPSLYDFAEISVDPSHSKLWKLHLDNYLKILTKINPNLETILNLAANPIYPKTREMSLKYFVDNFYIKYSKFYKPEEIDVAFLPCSNSNSYAKHSECFINDECKIMGFKIIREDLRSKAGDFGVRQNPNREKLIKMLIENPPKNKNKAKEVFEYLNTQQESFTDFDWKKLKDNEFIPINYESQSNKNINELDDLFKPQKKLNKDDVLIAIKTDSKGNDFYFLATVKEIYINDDKKLGCKSLHESVTKSVVPYGPIQKTKYSRQLQRIIRERASLFYLNHSEEHIRKDEKWLQKLKVREIEYMETTPLSNLKNMGIIHPKLQNDQRTSNTFPSQHNDVDISSENTRNLRNFLQ
ncbi:9916_t:CDS:2, partial [Rhizophagus irregularis]